MIRSCLVVVCCDWVLVDLNMDVVSRWMYMETKSRYTCGASLIDVGVVCCVVATGAIVMDRPVKKRSGIEPPFVPPPKHSEGKIVV